MNIHDFALGMGISVTHVDIDRNTVTHIEPSRDCYECDKPNGGDIPRRTADRTIYLCSYCDRITPTN
jgi:hypothetical protein